MSEFFLHSFNTLSHGLIGYIVPFLFVLTIVVFFHELGHFLVARWAGVKVLTFSLGFGPELAGFNDRHGTRWKISAVPLGGYVKFFGDESEASTPSSEALASMTAEEREGSFHHKKVGPRAAIVAAGPIANFLSGDRDLHLPVHVLRQAEHDRAGRSGARRAARRRQPAFKSGDVVTAIDGNKIDSFSDMQRIVGVRAGEQLTFTVKRGDSTCNCSGTPQLKEVKDRFRKHAPAWRAGHYPQDRRRRCHDRACGSRDRAVARRQGNLVRGRPHAGLYRRRFYRA